MVPVQREWMVMRMLFAEFIGTYALVFAGTGAIVINDITGGAISHAGIALTFGLVVMAMISAVGDISGAHFNPAVTLAFASGGRFPWRDVPAYALSQFLGGVAGSLTLRWLLPAHENMGATLPALSSARTFVFEFLLTFILMFVIIHVSTGSKEKGIVAGSAIGGTVALEALFAGTMTGASMNPARSLAPALVSGSLDGLWIYLTAPLLGAVAAMALCRMVREDCQAPAADPNPGQGDGTGSSRSSLR